jgi:uncharacterized membrane protein YhaH (DUF805 family)
MGFMEAVETCLRKYAVFRGRASRSEYWWFTLFQIIISATFFMFAFPNELHRLAVYKATHVLPPQGPGYAILGLVFDLVSLGLFLPNLGVVVRRLHDIDKSGWWYLFGFVPLIGQIMLLVWFCTRGTRKTNRFGSDPLYDF